MIDYELKAKVLESGLCKLQKKVSQAFFKSGVGDYGSDIDDSSLSLRQAHYLNEFYGSKKPLEWDEARKINNSSFARSRRLRQRISIMLAFSDCIFLTLTFTDEVLINTSPQTRRRYVSRFLNSLNCVYVANKDFGENKGREHYHAIVEKDFVDYSSWTYGSVNGQKVRSSADNVKLAKYISKLTNHSIKATTQRSALIYSRNFSIKNI